MLEREKMIKNKARILWGLLLCLWAIGWAEVLLSAPQCSLESSVVSKNDFKILRPGLDPQAVGANFCSTDVLLTQLLNNQGSSLDCCDTIIALLGNCRPSPIFSATVINLSGIYCLSNNINGMIIINSDDVNLDLNGFRVFGDTNGIIVNPGFQRVVIHNGVVSDTTEQAIIVGDGCRLISLYDLQVTDAGTPPNNFAIDFQGSSVGRVAECLIQNVTIARSQWGMFLHNTDNFQVVDCSIMDCISSTSCGGIFILADDSAAPCLYNQVKDCTVRNCVSTEESVGGIVAINSIGTQLINDQIISLSSALITPGIELLSTVGALIDNCTVTELSSSATGPVDDLPLAVLGIWLIDSSDTLIRNCFISDVGIDSAPIFLSAGVIISGASSTVTVDNVVVEDVGPTVTALAFYVDSSSNNVVIRNCVGNGIAASDLAQGMKLDGGDIFAQDSIIMNIAGTLLSNVAMGYSTIGNLFIGNNIFENCVAMSIGANNQSIGFYIEGFSALLNDCTAYEIYFGNSLTLVRGFDLTLNCTDVGLNNCTAFNISSENIAEGFNIEGLFCQLQNCSASFCDTNGFSVPLTAPAAGGVVINNCRAVAIAGTGINIASVASGTTVTNCYAAGNFPNYTPVVVPFVAVAGTAYTDPSVVVGFNTSA